MALPSSPKSIIVKAGSQFNGYVSNFNDNQKMKNFTFILKEGFFIFKVKEFSFYFRFKKSQIQVLSLY